MCIAVVIARKRLFRLNQADRLGTVAAWYQTNGKPRLDECFWLPLDWQGNLAFIRRTGLAVAGHRMSAAICLFKSNVQQIEDNSKENYNGKSLVQVFEV